MPAGYLEWGVFLYIGLIPIGWSPFPAQMQWADLAFVGLGLAILAARQPRRLSFHALDVFVAAYLAGSLLSFRRTPDLMQSALAFAKQAYLVLVYGACSLLARERGLAAKMLRWTAGVAAVLAAAGLLALGTFAAGIPWLAPLLTVGVLPEAGKTVRITGPLMSPGFFCNYLTVAFPILLALILPPHRQTLGKWLRVVLAAAAAAGTATYSIVGFIGAGLAAVWASWQSTTGGRRLRLAAGSLFLLLLLAANVVFAVSFRDVQWIADRDAQPPPPQSGYAFQDAAGARRLRVSLSYNPISYLLLKRVAMQAFLREPLTGVGLGMFHRETERAYAQGAIHQPYRHADPHCELLGRLAETGVVGGLTLLILWWGVAHQGCGLLRGAPASAWMSRAILAGFVGVLVNSLNADVMNFRFVWVGLGVLRAQRARGPS